MARQDDGLHIARLVADNAPLPLAKLKFKARKMKLSEDVFMDGFDYAIDKGWIEEFGDGITITERGREDTGPAI